MGFTILKFLNNIVNNNEMNFEEGCKGGGKEMDNNIEKISVGLIIKERVQRELFIIKMARHSVLSLSLSAIILIKVRGGTEA